MKTESELKFIYWIKRILRLKPVKKKVLPSEELRSYIAENLQCSQTAPDTGKIPVMQDAYSEEQQDSLEEYEDSVEATEYPDEPLWSKQDSFREEPWICYSKSQKWDDVFPCEASAKPPESQEKPLSAAKPFRVPLSAGEKKKCSEPEPDIARLIRNRDESFQQMLFREIDSRGMTDVECYRRAHMDRKTFSKIRSDIQYRPKKTTAVSLALALKMTAEEAEDLLKKAGYSFSNSSIFDIIIQYYMEKGKYDLFEINETLYYYDQPLLGTR